ncbi:ribonuclease HI [Photobacterium angustum]|uniref:ribonuclease H n=1 Tax=Photobacterium angustum TaxID=661 RepID=A0ABX5H7F4_PHOAN|nr:ribonuclease H family protein [Photobacterium angustum]KJG36063.1 ribonuclease HI [Photobacterium angustum]PSX11804.1 ribonuclease HI [Photobacterium angustum]
MAKKFYVVWQGREPGIYTDWTSCKQQVDKFAGAKYKSFPSQEEAQAAFGGKVPTYRASAATKNASKTVKTSKGSLTAEQVQAVKAEIKIFTDGGCDPNPGKAGSGLALYRENQLSELWFGLYNPQGTNNTAELNALYQALLQAEKYTAGGISVAIFCDSRYSIQCITQWAVSWNKNGWKKAGGEIKNLDLIQPMFERYQTIKDMVQIYHVNGHVGIEGNELADRMSILAVDEREVAFSLYQHPLDIKAILALRAG